MAKAKPNKKQNKKAKELEKTKQETKPLEEKLEKKSETQQIEKNLKKQNKKANPLTSSIEKTLAPNILFVLFGSIILVLIFIIGFQVYLFQLNSVNQEALEKNEEDLSLLKTELQPILDIIREQANQEEQQQIERPTSLNIKPPDLSTEYFRGNPDADVVLVEYSDYSCPFCGRVHPTLKSLIQQDSNLAWVYRDYPIINPESARHAEAAYCGGELGGNEVYWNFVDAMLVGGFRFSMEEFVKIAEESEISVDEFKNCYESRDMQERVMSVVKEAIESLSNYQLGTPTTVVYNRKTGKNRLVVGALPKESFLQAIEEVR